jgi:hypothetical protein
MGVDQRFDSKAILDQLFWSRTEEPSQRSVQPAVKEAAREFPPGPLEQAGTQPAELKRVLNPDDCNRPRETAGQENPPAEPSAAADREPDADVYEPEPSAPLLEEILSISGPDAAPPPILFEEADAAHGQFRTEPKLLDEICVLGQAERIELPHICRVLVSTLLQTKEVAPVCILLPSTDYVAQFTAILASFECLALDFPAARADFIDRSLKPGTKVRALPEGNVFVVGDRCEMSGIDGIFLHYTDKQTSVTRGRHLFPIGQMLRFEPTTRKLPVSRSSIRLSASRRSKVDELAGTAAFGNTMLYRTRVVLVGARTRFEHALDLALLIKKNSQDPDLSPLSPAFAWGTFDAAGKPIVLSPGGSAGYPLVSISRDFIDLEKASLTKDVEFGSQLVITDRLDLVLKSMDLANQVGARQRLLLVAEARKRADIDPLLRHGWKVWEPRPCELVKPSKIDIKPTNIGVPGIDRIERSAYAELHPSLGYMEKRSPVLSAAYRGLSDLGDMLSGEAAIFDERMQEILEKISGVFFQSANWLSPPAGDALSSFSASLQDLISGQPYIERYLGTKAGAALGAYASAIRLFQSDCAKTGITPKGQALLDLAQNASRDNAFDQIFVTGVRRSREEADQFLSTHGIPISCRLVSELTDGDDFPKAIVFSVMRRDIFTKMIDPWPAKSVVFAGYDFELEVYKRRLRVRAMRKKKLEFSPEARTTLTSYPANGFVSDAIQSTPPPIADEKMRQEQDFDVFDAGAASGEWDWRRRITIPGSVPGEQTQEATVVRFVGRSWMPMTDDHQLLRLLQTGKAGTRSDVEDIELVDLQVGDRIIVREGGERDVIRAIAEHICGEDKYESLRQRAGLWRAALKSTGSDASQIAKRLADGGIRRHIATVRGWLSNPALIGPRSDDDILAIGDVFPLPGKGSSDWSACIEAISELRGLHLSAGMRLSENLMGRCGRMLLEPADTELAVNFDLGLVWVLEVADVDRSPRSCPNSIINRLQWLDSSWREHLIKDSLKAGAS